ncbi:MAG TPA: NAD-dependent epimerase/dehydratase family protein [Kofleriaceae bacterium]
MTRVALAGAHGFIGSAARRAITAAGHDVIPLARGETAPCDVLVWAAGRREADFAANRAVHVDAPVAAARSAARVIYLSTGECYGDAPLPYREDGPCLGTSDYARAKLEGERALADVAPTTILRIGVGYGPGQAPRLMIPQVVAALRAGQPIALTEGTQTRDFVFVDDIAEAIVAAIDVGTAPAVINIGSGIEITIREAARIIARALGAPESLLGFGQIPMRQNEAMRYVLDVTRAAEVLGWKARTSFADGTARL